MDRHQAVEASETVRQVSLDDHLNVGIGGAFELLDQTLAVALVGLHGELVLADDVVEVLGGTVNLSLDVLGDLEFDWLRIGQVRADSGVGEVNFVVENEIIDVVVQAMGRSAIHHGVLAHEARSAVVVNNELKRLVKPAILAISMPYW
ncbi:hypothetical protein HYQ46_004501 [Verticillium longisporum]|nr:hypothetical protein HYQ46_004501 [Verticillium longisporum]